MIFQVRAVSRFRCARACFSVCSSVALAWKAFSNGLFVAGLVGDDVDLLDRVGSAVEVEIEPHVEEVLMIRGVQLRRDQVAVLRLLALAERAERQDAGQLDLELDVPSW